jgi:hypothetical protein
MTDREFCQKTALERECEKLFQDGVGNSGVKVLVGEASRFLTSYPDYLRHTGRRMR